jgi:hypothetical protein
MLIGESTGAIFSINKKAIQRSHTHTQATDESRNCKVFHKYCPEGTDFKEAVEKFFCTFVEIKSKNYGANLKDIEHDISTLTISMNKY